MRTLTPSLTNGHGSRQRRMRDEAQPPPRGLDDRCGRQAQRSIEARLSGSPGRVPRLALGVEFSPCPRLRRRQLRIARQGQLQQMTHSPPQLAFRDPYQRVLEQLRQGPHSERHGELESVRTFVERLAREEEH